MHCSRQSKSCQKRFYQSYHEADTICHGRKRGTVGHGDNCKDRVDDGRKLELRPRRSEVVDEVDLDHEPNSTHCRCRRVVSSRRHAWRSGVDTGPSCCVKRQEVHSSSQTDSYHVKQHGLYKFASRHDREAKDSHDGYQVPQGRVMCSYHWRLVHCQRNCGCDRALEHHRAGAHVQANLRPYLFDLRWLLFSWSFRWRCLLALCWALGRLVVAILTASGMRFLGFHVS